MGFFDFFWDVWDFARDKVETIFDRIKDKLGLYSYSSSIIEDQIDVDKVLAECRETIKRDVSKAEEECMKKVSSLFGDLKKKTKTKFPDLIDIIDVEQKNAERELAGTVMQYVKEHLSKNDEEFLGVLEMPPGKAKQDALKLSTEKVLRDAKNLFYSKLKCYAEHILTEFMSRLDIRMANQDAQMRKRIEEMQKLEEESNKGEINMVALRDRCAPIMESAECIISILETEIT